MNRLLTLISTDTEIPSQADAEFQNYNELEKRLILKCGGSKGKLLKLYRRVKGRDAYFAGAKHGITVLTGGSTTPPPVISTCPPELAGETLVSDNPRASGAYGSGLKQRGGELFVGETSAVGSTNQIGEVHYYTRADAASAWSRQSGFFSSTQSQFARFGQAIDYNGSRVVVGAPGINTVDVFTFSGGSETHEQQITPNGVDSGQLFGRAVAISGSHMLIGAPNHDDTFTAEGNVEYWSKSGAAWTFQQRIKRDGGPAAGEGWGQGIAMVDEDTAFVAYVNSNELHVQRWTRSGSTWTYQSEFQVGDLSYPGGVNYCTLDTDGTNLIIGCDGYDFSTGSGRVVVVFDQTGGVTSEIIGDSENILGGAVTISGGQAVIGYRFDSTEASNSGKAEVWNICI